MIPLQAGGLGRLHANGRGVRGVDLELRPGEVVGLLGPNGSGKSTLLRVLATADPPSEGRVAWFGNPDRRATGVRRRLGVLLDSPAHFDDLGGRQNAWFFARRHGLGRAEARRRVDELLEWAGLAAARELPVREYSLGMKRRLGLVEAFAHRPDLLLLDEPTLGLDYEGELDLARAISQAALGGASAVVATNDLELARRCCERTLELSFGRVVA